MISPTPKRTRIAARDRLLTLPDVFSVADLALVMQTSKLEASQYLWRWKGSGLVRAMGGNAGVFLNLVRNPQGSEDAGLWERGLLKAMPSAIIGGHEVLADAGITTQITHRRYVLVSAQDSRFQLDQAEVHPRPEEWLDRLVREGGVVQSESGLAPRLVPGAALADLLLYADRRPDPDDIDFEELTSADRKLYRLLSGTTNYA